jgi:hypothetical protein
LLADIPFTVKDIVLACSKLRGNAAPGPDGVPAMLLKTCRKQLATPLHHLWRVSLEFPHAFAAQFQTLHTFRTPLRRKFQPVAIFFRMDPLIIVFLLHF